MNAAKLVSPPEPLGKKVPRTGGPAPEEAILRALNAAQPLIEDYQGWAVDDLDALWREFQSASESKRLGKAHVDRLFAIAHEIRGQGGTFGFPLVTAIGDSLCKLLDGRTALPAPAMDGIRVHILAMKAVFRQGLKGDAGALGREIPTLFRLLRERLQPALSVRIRPRG